MARFSNAEYGNIYFIYGFVTKMLELHQGNTSMVSKSEESYTEVSATIHSVLRETDALCLQDGRCGHCRGSCRMKRNWRMLHMLMHLQEFVANEIDLSRSACMRSGWVLLVYDLYNAYSQVTIFSSPASISDRR
jgi:hypothetical protein